jgi:hypothetical protein
VGGWMYYSRPFDLNRIEYMITITFYKLNGHTNSVNKTLVDGVDIAGHIRGECNILTPTLKIRSDKLFDYNYCYIPEFKRYYFVKSVTAEFGDNTVYNVQMTVDVLQTYKDNILQSTGTITESDSAGRYVSNRNGVYDVRPNFTKVDFPNKGLFNDEGSIIMITIKGSK